MRGVPPVALKAHATPKVGKHVRSSLYVHRMAVGLLGREQCERVGVAAAIAPGATWNVARLDPTTVCLLEYEDFEAAIFPRLLASTLVDAVGRVCTSRDYRGAANPLILHRKELLVDPGDHRRAAWASLTADLEARGLFSDLIRIGREKHWEALLLAEGLDRLRRSP